MSTFLHGLAELARSLPRGRRGLAVAVLGVFGGLSGLVFLTGSHVARSASPFLFERVDDAPERSVAVVPGCRVFPDGTPSAMLEDRLATSLDLYRVGRVRAILVSGDSRDPSYDETAVMRRWLVERGVPDRDLLVDPLGTRTLETMSRAARVLGIASAVVCTQRFHLARSVFLARRFGIDAVGVVADRRAYAGIRADGLREAYARSVAFFEVHALGKGAKR